MRKMLLATCADCGLSWGKRADSFKEWDGRCRSCAQRLRGNLPVERQRRSVVVAGLLAGGWKPFVKTAPMTQVGVVDKRRILRNPLGSCMDCGVLLKLRGARRCRQCYGISIRGVTRPGAYLAGKDHPNWKGGQEFWKRPTTRPMRKDNKIWRMSVLTRDNFTCQACGRFSPPPFNKGVLHADHILPWATHPELRCDIDNGRTLCISCHMETPTWGWRGWHASRKALVN